MNPETYPYCQGDESNEAEINFLADMEMQRRKKQRGECVLCEKIGTSDCPECRQRFCGYHRTHHEHDAPEFVEELEEQQVKKTPICQACKQPAKRMLLIKGVSHWFCEEHFDETVVQRAEYAVSLRELHWNE